MKQLTKVQNTETLSFHQVAGFGTLYLPFGRLKLLQIFRGSAAVDIKLTPIRIYGILGTFLSSNEFYLKHKLI